MVMMFLVVVVMMLILLVVEVVMTYRADEADRAISRSFLVANTPPALLMMILLMTPKNATLKMIILNMIQKSGDDESYLSKGRPPTHRFFPTLEIGTAVKSGASALYFRIVFHTVVQTTVKSGAVVHLPCSAE